MHNVFSLPFSQVANLNSNYYLILKLSTVNKIIINFLQTLMFTCLHSRDNMALMEGHVVIVSQSAACGTLFGGASNCVDLTWNPERTPQQHDRPRNTWRRDLEADVEETGHNWRRLERLIQDRRVWLSDVGGLCPRRGDEGFAWLIDWLTQVYIYVHSTFRSATIFYVELRSWEF